MHIHFYSLKQIKFIEYNFIDYNISIVLEFQIIN